MPKTKIKDFTIRKAQPEDVGLVLAFIKELADYEQLLGEVTATEEILHKTIFIDHRAEVVIGEYQGEPVSFALFFHNFSTFLGKPGLYLEDLYVRPTCRGLGIGKEMLSYLAKLALERDCGRLEWVCLDWNESSISFYKRLGAVPMEDWTIYRLQGESLRNMAEND